MKLTIQHVFDATPILGAIMRENRPLPSKGKYRIARMHRKMEAEWTLIAERYNGTIKAYDHQRPMIGGLQVEPTEENLKDPACVMQDAVPDGKMAEFLAAWKDVASEEIEVAVEPIPIDQLCLDNRNDGITAAEFSILDTLVEG